MSGLELLADEIDGRLHAAVVRKTVLFDLYADSAAPPAGGRWGSVYLGKVIKIDKSLDAAVVDLGGGVSGFLSAKHVHFPGGDKSESRTGIAELLKPGEMILVQVKSESKNASAHEQNKMARLTMKLCMFGQYLVYCPVASQVTMSRQIQSEALIALTAKLKGKGGWIVESAAELASEDDILHETKKLQEDWHGILSEKSASEGRPRLLKAGANALVRALCDYGEKSFDHIYAGNKRIFEMMTEWCDKNSPGLAASKRLRLFKPERTSQKLFDIHDVFSEIESLKESRVALASGGSIIIEPTHALTVIDVNQGSGSMAEANAEAAREIARQARLRNLSGAIVVDFINLPHRAERAKVLDEMEKAFAGDHASAQVHGFTRLGIAEITRKRRTGAYLEKISA